MEDKPTPETDAANKYIVGNLYVPAEFARKIEQERDKYKSLYYKLVKEIESIRAYK